MITDAQRLNAQIEAYIPATVQEMADKQNILRYMAQFDDTLTRNNPILHFTASSWVVNPDRSKALMIYHNIYDSWAWTGGHADGNADLFAVAVKEAKEETGLDTFRSDGEIFSLEILCVNGHVKRGSYISSHLHLNLTYLLTADEQEQLRIKPDENSGVSWFPLAEAVEASSEPWMRGIYKKLNSKL